MRAHLTELLREHAGGGQNCSHVNAPLLREAADAIEELERGRTSFESRIDYLERVIRESGHVVGYHPHGTEKEESADG